MYWQSSEAKGLDLTYDLWTEAADDPQHRWFMHMEFPVAFYGNHY